MACDASLDGDLFTLQVVELGLEMCDLLIQCLQQVGMNRDRLLELGCRVLLRRLHTGERCLLGLQAGQLLDHQPLVGLDGGRLEIGAHPQHLESGEGAPVLAVGASEVLHADGDVADPADGHRQGRHVSTAGDVGTAGRRNGLSLARGNFYAGAREILIGLTELDRQPGELHALRVHAGLHRLQFRFRDGQLGLDRSQLSRRFFDFRRHVGPGRGDVVDDPGELFDAIPHPPQLVVEVVRRRRGRKGGEKDDRSERSSPQRAAVHFLM